MPRRVLIAGFGYLGGAIARRLVAAGDRVWGLRRRPPAPLDAVETLAADLGDPRSLARLPDGLDHVVYAASADRFDDRAYQRAYVDGPVHLLRALADQGQHPRRVVLVSSTSVYGQSDGGWVDEDTEARAKHFSGALLARGENAWLAGPFPATVLRIGGLYGPGRTRLVEEVRAGRARCYEGDPVYTNRIHRDDAAGALVHLFSLEVAEPVYLGVDSEPADRNEVLRWLAARLRVATPPLVPRPAADAARALRANKRCRNRRLAQSGYRFRFPTYREGYGPLLGGGAP